MVNYKKIRELRIKSNISQLEMAQKIHMSQNSYSRLENGISKLDVNVLEKVATVFGIGINELIEESPVNFNFNEKVENGYATYIQILNSDNKDLIALLKEQLLVKDNQIEKLMRQLQSKSNND